MMGPLTILKDLPKSKGESVIVFDRAGALDFSERVTIYLSLKKKNGYVEIHPCDLMNKLYMPGLSHILDDKMFSIFKRCPHISDKNENLPIADRFTKVYYVADYCFQHSHHWQTGSSRTKQFNIEEAMEYIKKEKLDFWPYE